MAISRYLEKKWAGVPMTPWQRKKAAPVKLPMKLRAIFRKLKRRVIVQLRFRTNKGYRGAKRR